ncbi:uncharacterized protein MELLADRAFT_65755 [Melampsora larici-populina 98AG31]|uniref:Uncharacterized protein n=1 Tax=Melampsora larici-populina (strain 98AG31 / pathotype 3-4-7) TaxID=747676 RepID=F4RWL2_MELLP|nr:uncharacterized protein MELLADRAFT_65755 [Melampsora larici-populina 98AG31]EGG03215.1 hypothetical protein MELLADRAFT_65755 [Melampsora larici-populina 98AG31]
MRVTYDTPCHFICKKCLNKNSDLEEAASNSYPEGHQHAYQGEINDLEQQVVHKTKSEAKEGLEEEEKLPKVDKIKGKRKTIESLGDSDDNHSIQRKDKKQKIISNASNSNIHLILNALDQMEGPSNAILEENNMSKTTNRTYNYAKNNEVNHELDENSIIQMFQ